MTVNHLSAGCIRRLNAPSWEPLVLILQLNNPGVRVAIIDDVHDEDTTTVSDNMVRELAVTEEGSDLRGQLAARVRADDDVTKLLVPKDLIEQVKDEGMCHPSP